MRRYSKSASCFFTPPPYSPDGCIDKKCFFGLVFFIKNRSYMDWIHILFYLYNPPSRTIKQNHTI